jgi:tRNA A-37 threonylcarbamoyl transferase component Bud32
MKSLHINPAYAERLANGKCASFESILRLKDEGNGAPGFVIRQLPGDPPLEVFFKVYCPSSRWRFWIRKSKARREAENMAALHRLRVPVADWIAWGEDRDGIRRLRRAFVLSTALSNVCRLDEFFKSRPAVSDRWAVIESLAMIVAQMHRAHFFYYDLHWRNILVQRTAGGAPQVYLVDCPRGQFAHFLVRRRRIRDLAVLDKTASELCTGSERLLFLESYLGPEATQDEVLELAHACLKYRRIRWPGAWRNDHTRPGDEVIRIPNSIPKSA